MEMPSFTEESLRLSQCIADSKNTVLWRGCVISFRKMCLYFLRWGSEARSTWKSRVRRSALHSYA